MVSILVTLYVVVLCIAIGSIILYGSNPSRSLGWILVIIFIPFAGVISYLMFGINRREFKIFTLKRTLERKLYDKEHLDDYANNKEVLFSSLNKQKLASLLKKALIFQLFLVIKFLC